MLCPLVDGQEDDGDFPKVFSGYRAVYTPGDPPPIGSWSQVMVLPPGRVMNIKNKAPSLVSLSFYTDGFEDDLKLGIIYFLQSLKLQGQFSLVLLKIFSFCNPGRVESWDLFGVTGNALAVHVQLGSLDHTYAFLSVDFLSYRLLLGS